MRRRFGFTTRASCLLAAGITAVLCGLVLGETDLLRAGVLAVAVPCVTALVVSRSRLRIANRRSVEPAAVRAGQSLTVHLGITNRSVLPTGALMLEDQLPENVPGRARFVLASLPRHESRTVSYRLPGLGRGRYRIGPLSVRVTDPFRMIDLTRWFTATDDFLVTPVIDELPPIDPPRSDELGDGAGSNSIGAHGADDASTREYRMGDDLRKIHWRSSARTGALMVRQEERPWRTRTTVLLDLRASAHVDGGASDRIGSGSLDPSTGIDNEVIDPRLGSSLEWAVSAAASIASLAIGVRREVGLVADPAVLQRLTFGNSTTLARHLALARAQRHANLGALETALRGAARDSALVAVVGRLGPDDLRLLADLQPRARTAPALGVLLDVDSWRAPAGPGSPTRSAKGGASPDVPASAALLRQAGWRVVIVRRGMTTAEVWRLLLATGSPPATADIATSAGLLR